MIVAYLENFEEKLPKGALVTIAAALQAKRHHGYGKAVGILIGGAGTESAANEAAKYGLDEVVFVKSDALRQYLAVPYTLALKGVIEQLSPRLVIALGSTRGKDLMPRIAELLQAGQASDVMAFTENQGFRRPMYAGNVIAEVEITTEKKVATLRGTAFEPASVTGATAPVRELKVDLGGTFSQEFVAFDTVKSERPELTEAAIVVSGGRAMKSAENFQTYIAPLADALGAAIGASRAAVDSGYAPNDWQVGQTGKVVAPSLYVAVGISGAIQHLAGMKDSKVIAAINKDPDAPIFEVADYGLVADLYQAVPELTAEIKRVKG